MLEITTDAFQLAPPLVEENDSMFAPVTLSMGTITLPLG